jgi:hypothetical protein
MNKIEEIISKWEKDSKLDDTELSRESMNIPYLHSQYLREYSDARVKRLYYNKKLSKKYIELSEYYKGNLNNPESLKELGKEPWPRSLLKEDIKRHIETDDTYVEINEKVQFYEEIIEISKYILDAINRRSFTIKNAIDFQRFTNGM